MDTKRKIVLAGAAVSLAAMWLGAAPASARTLQQAQSSCTQAGGEWDWYIPSGGQARYECILVYGNDHYAIETFDGSGETQWTCWNYPDSEEVCYVD